MAPMTPLEIWPVFGLRIRTPRIELRPVEGDLAFSLASLAGEGIHDPEVMPFFMPWTDVPAPELQRNAMRHYWESWAGFRIEQWSLPFAVLTHEDDTETDADADSARVVGTQSVHRVVDYPALRTFETGSWLGRAFQRQGIGKEARAAVLHFMFEGLGALEATTSAFTDNAASLAVTRSLGYIENGQRRIAPRGTPATELLFRLPRDEWQARRRDDITIEGLDDRCLAFFGLAPDLSALQGGSA